ALQMCIASFLTFFVHTAEQHLIKSCLKFTCRSMEVSNDIYAPLFEFRFHYFHFRIRQYYVPTIEIVLKIKIGSELQKKLAQNHFLNKCLRVRWFACDQASSFFEGVTPGKASITDDPDETLSSSLLDFSSKLRRFSDSAVWSLVFGLDHHCLKILSKGTCAMGARTWDIPNEVNPSSQICP
ncbi:unnamed protein product, partial [Nesidiocoris tenuis]